MTATQTACIACKGACDMTATQTACIACKGALMRPSFCAHTASSFGCLGRKLRSSRDWRVCKHQPSLHPSYAAVLCLSVKARLGLKSSGAAVLHLFVCAGPPSTPTQWCRYAQFVSLCKPTFDSSHWLTLAGRMDPLVPIMPTSTGSK